MRILLLNPPFDRACVRDNYCSYSSKAGDLWSPLDLLVQSGVLRERHDVSVLDAVAQERTDEECVDRSAKFDAVLALCGSLSWERDARLLARMKQANPALRLIVTGDFLVTEAAAALDRHSCLDAVLTDYTAEGLARWLSGEAPPHAGLALRGPGSDGRLPEDRPGGGVIRYPRPAHELFVSERYRLSVLEPGPFAVVITSFGCNFHCPYCIDSILPIRYRPVDDVLSELAWLEGRGVRSILFYDPNFTARPARVLELTGAIVAKGLSPAYACNATVACLTPAVVMALAASGCKTVMLGLESGDDGILKRNRKGFLTAQVREAIGWCKEAGLRVLGYFLLGLPGETATTAAQTIEFASSLPLDYASFNIFSPSTGTVLGRPFLQGGGPAPRPSDRSLTPGESHCQLSPEELGRIRRAAIWKFYSRPGYVGRQILSLTSARELGRKLAAAGRLFRGALG